MCAQYLFLDCDGLQLAIFGSDNSEVGEGGVSEEDIEVHSNALEA